MYLGNEKTYFPSHLLTQRHQKGKHLFAVFSVKYDKKLNGREDKKKTNNLSLDWFSRSYGGGRWVEIKRLSLSRTQDQLNRLRINLSHAVI